MLFGDNVQSLLDTKARRMASDKPFDVFYTKGYEKIDENFKQNDLSAWSILELTNDRMDIQLNFTEPDWVSGGYDEPCYINLQFGDGSQFINAGHGQPMETVNFRKRLVRQIKNDDAS